jgi:hypothetical protein
MFLQTNMYQALKNNFHYHILTAIFFLLAAGLSFAQTADTLKNTEPVLINADTTVAKKEPPKKHSPRVAAIRSAMLPGLGQIYNKKYWKLPIVYGAMGVSGGIFFFNLKNYKETRHAYKVKYNYRQPGATAADTIAFNNLKPHLKPLSEESLRYYRTQYRRDLDYAAIFFLVMWGLNVVDATVDAHLKSFDVSPDLSLRIKPGRSELAGTNGVSLILSFKDKQAK